MRPALWVGVVLLTGCWAPVPDHASPDAGPWSFDAGTWVCGPGTCAGCCDRGRCRSGTSESACGHGGAACAECGNDALCGPSNACEPLDPHRYETPANPGEESRSTGSTCRTLNGAWVCW